MPIRRSSSPGGKRRGVGISTPLASASLNIAELLNKSRGEYAYTLIDTDGSVDNTVMDKVRAIGGVLAARVI